MRRRQSVVSDISERERLLCSERGGEIVLTGMSCTNLCA